VDSMTTVPCQHGCQAMSLAAATGDLQAQTGRMSAGLCCSAAAGSSPLPASLLRGCTRCHLQLRRPASADGIKSAWFMSFHMPCASAMR
jgi:hypothetical protein